MKLRHAHPSLGRRLVFTLMLAFGLGTLPNLLLAGLLAAQLKQFIRHRVVRALAGGSILAFGVWGTAAALRQLG